MSCIKRFVKDFTLRSDMFAAAPVLRFNGQSSYESIFGGCLSILLVIGFAVIFSTSFIDVLTKVNISSSVDTEDNPYSEAVVSDIKLAIGIDGLDFSVYQRYFSIILLQKNITNQGAPSAGNIPLEPCQSGDWHNLGNNFDKLYQVHNMSEMLCPSPSTSLSVQGFPGSELWKSYYVLVERCENQTGASYVCYDPATIQSMITTHFTTSDYFKVKLYIVDTVISPSLDNPVSTVLEEEIFATFSQNSGSRGTVKLGVYNVTTDNSIWPITSITYETGHYITKFTTNSIELYSTHYVRIQIEKDNSIHTVARVHQKLDNMLSYVGGLFALLFGWIFFFIGSYNEYKYEIAVARNAFAMDGTGRKIHEKNFGFFTYLKYSIFDWLKTFGINCKWKRMEDIDAARGEACEQMDVQYLIKKIQRFELVNKYLIGEHNLICSNLTRPPTLDQVKNIRKITQYYDKVIKQQEEESMVKALFALNNKEGDGPSNRITNEESLNQVQSEQQNEVDSDFDSQDEIAEEAIIESLKKLNRGDKNNEITNLILEGIPPKMKRRLKEKQRSQKTDKLVVSNLEESKQQFIQCPNTAVFLGPKKSGEFKQM